MTSTSLSLLKRLQRTDDADNWNRLAELYTPLLLTWMRKYEVQDSDAHDIVQEVLLAVLKDIKSFDHNGRPGAFRSWLRTILVYRLRNFWRAGGRRPQVYGGTQIERQLDQLEDPASDLSQLWNQQHDRQVARQLLALTKSSFAPKTWKAFCRVALDGVRADVVGQELGISVNAVLLAKSRVLKRLRKEADGLIDDSSSFLGKC